MATKKQIGYGSQGSEVTELQKLLNQNGYQLDEDGIFGTNTQSAVRDYQQKNKLAVDGIVGDNTWGALTNVTTKAPAPSTNISAGTAPVVNDFSYDPFKVSDSTAAADQKRQEVSSQKPGEFTYGAYEKSDVVKQAEEMLKQQLAQKPGAYQSGWQAQLDEAIQKILNREKFNYDLNGDALYQQYKDQYMLQGQQAMMDTMGQAAAMTGGYRNSYAQTVGQQAYQGHLQQLNDRVPELYQLALNKYQMEGDAMAQQMALLAQQEEQDYGRYRDTVSDYNAELDRLTEDSRYQSESDYNRFLDAYNMAYGQHRDTVSDWQNEQNRADEDFWNQYNRDYGQYADQRDFAYGQFADDRNLTYDNYWKDKSFGYQQDRDKAADEQWQKEFDEAVRQWNLKNGVSTSTGGNTTANPQPVQPTQPQTPQPNYDNGSLGKGSVIMLQKALGMPNEKCDGYWGPETAALAKSKWGTTSADDAYNKYLGKDKNGNTITYTDVANAAAELRKKGASVTEISQVINSMVKSSDYKPTTSASQDLAELRSGYVGIGR